MGLRNYPFRILLTTTLTSLLLLALCGGVALYLYSQQSATAEVLGENISSRRAASALQESLEDLVALHSRGGVAEVAPLYERVDAHLAEIEALADKPQERDLAQQLADSYRRYRERWGKAASSGESGQALAAFLQADTLPTCRSLRDFNTRQIDESELVHRRTLAWMGWGLVAVGAIGSLAGLTLGYGLARGLSRTIHQLRIRVQDAADKLSQELPAVEFTRADGFADPLQDEARELVCQVEQVVDKLQQREREVRRAEQLAAVGQLAAGVAHEVRNPLTSIKMIVQAGRDPGVTMGLSDDDMQIIEQEVRRMERSLETFLNFARPSRLEHSPQDLAALVGGIFGLVRGRADKQRVALRLIAPATPLILEADGAQLQQVILNLVLNALDAMPRTGTLEVEVRSLPGGIAELLVRDTGPGVAPEAASRLFQPFVTTKDTGLGLGLVVSRRIVEDHGGSIQAANRTEGGACFTVRLPAARPMLTAS
jgi:two-component system, NtrC family, sensor histidine kinase HydH